MNPTNNTTKYGGISVSQLGYCGWDQMTDELMICSLENSVFSTNSTREECFHRVLVAACHLLVL